MKSKAHNISAGHRFAILLCLSLLFAGCDGAYYLVPAQEAGARPATVTESEIVLNKAGLSVMIKGGHTQPPLPKKVLAHYLTVYVRIQCDYPREWYADSVCLSSAGRLIQTKGAIYRFRDPNSHSYRKVESECQEEWPSVNYPTLVLDSGKSSFEFFFLARDGGLDRLEFPITLHLGMITSASDTLSLQGLVFNAERGIPKNEYN